MERLDPAPEPVAAIVVKIEAPPLVSGRLWVRDLAASEACEYLSKGQCDVVAAEHLDIVAVYDLIIWEVGDEAGPGWNVHRGVSWLSHGAKPRASPAEMPVAASFQTVGVLAQSRWAPEYLSTPWRSPLQPFPPFRRFGSLLP